MSTRKKKTDNQLRFAVFILTHGRPDNVITYKTLRRSGYSGDIYLIVDNADLKLDEYIAQYGNEVVVFDKSETAKTFDQGDNFPLNRGVVYARNESFRIAKNLGVKYFLQLDDDYRHFQFRFNDQLNYWPRVTKSLDQVFLAIFKFYNSCPQLTSIAISQGGDFIGGDGSPQAQVIKLSRKCMNSFFCSTERPFNFLGRINEDVTTYARLATTGCLFFTTNQLSLEQTQTQQNSGGMTELYLDSGTYVKSFYSVMYQPSSVRVRVMQSKFSRIHHQVIWANTTPKILREPRVGT